MVGKDHVTFVLRNHRSAEAFGLQRAFKDRVVNDWKTDRDLTAYRVLSDELVAMLYQWHEGIRHSYRTTYIV